MIYKIFFVLGYNVSNFFRKKKYKITIFDFLLGVVVLMLIIGTPIIIYVYSNDIASLLIEKFEISNIYIFDVEILFQFSILIIYTLTFMAYYISKIHFVKNDAISCKYLVDSFYYVSNINGRVKKILLRKVDDSCTDFKDEILLNIVPFRRIKIGSKALVLSRKYRGINIYVLDGDKKPITLGFSLIVLLEVLACIVFIILLRNL